MTRLAPLAALLALTAPAAAQTVMTPGEYEALAEGRTLHFTHRGRPFGAEQYFPGRRSLWRFADGTCTPGSWHAEGDDVCFTYEPDAPALCWRFERHGARISATLLPNAADPAPDLRLDLGRIDDAPLPCPAPDLGM